ncbi:MAG: YceI family protein [Roseobacter sp.]|jgi:polyisoprenoid-binding protein YceI|nr:YceI family protein [Roseobacter sp.]
MKSLLLASAFAVTATLAAAAETYKLDPSHSQVLFSYNHLGFSTTFGMFSGFEGEITFDQENPEASSVTVSMPTKSMFTGWEARDAHFMNADFFAATDEDLVTFTSTSIDVMSDNTALITGDLTMNDITKSVVLDATLNQLGPNPLTGQDWAGFDATTTILRSDFGLGLYAPAVSDEVEVTISIEASKVTDDNS